MSLGGPAGGGRSSFGRKGSSSSAQKKARRKKQEYHRHKLKFVEEGPKKDSDELKNRVILSLEKLGQQKFATEPGGYSFDNWMTSLNLLLDDFEEKAGRERLPLEYVQLRGALTEELTKPVDVADINDEIAKYQAEERRINLEILDAGYRRRDSKERMMRIQSESMESLRKTRDGYSSELGDLQSKLDHIKGEVLSTSFFRRVFSMRGSSASSIQKRIGDLRGKIQRLNEQIFEQEKRKTKIRSETGQQDKGLAADIEADLSELVSKISELEEIKAERLELVRKRFEVTKALAESISKLEHVGPPAEAPLAEAATTEPAETVGEETR